MNLVSFILLTVRRFYKLLGKDIQTKFKASELFNKQIPSGNT